MLRRELRFDQYLVATSCRRCRDPVCMVGCPVGSIRRNESLEIVIEDWCIGCGLCANQYLYRNINLHPFPVQEASDPGETRASLPSKKAILRSLLALAPKTARHVPRRRGFRVEPRTFFAEHIGKQ
jgi:Fe-S-cluster-containing dehydrogenase component